MTKPVITDTTFVSQWPPGPSFCQGRKLSFLYPFKWLWSHACKRSVFLSSYWSARWTETRQLIEQWGNLISTSDAAWNCKLKLQKGKYTPHLSFPQESVQPSHSSTLVVRESITKRVRLWAKQTGVQLSSFKSAFFELVYLLESSISLRSDHPRGGPSFSLREVGDGHVASVARNVPRGIRPSMKENADLRGSFSHQLTSG